MNRARLLCLSPLMLLGLAGTAQATVCHVTPDGSGNGSSWATAMSLQTALADTSCTEIWVRKGVYKPVVPAETYPSNAERKISFVVRPGARIYGGFAGTEILRDEVVGGIGISSGTPAQDQEVAQAAIDTWMGAQG